MPSATALKAKQLYNEKMQKLLESHDKAFLVHADNVGSKQFMDIRTALRPESCILMGKNTMMRKCMRDYAERTGSNVWDVMAEQLVGNVGIVFTTGELVDVRAKIAEHVVPAPARMNAVAPLDVIIPAGPTGMEPSQTGFFQVLNIATKINKGSIEILSEVVVVREGEKVTSSAATLLAKMGFTPFFYGLETKMVYDKGNMYDVAVLDISDADISAMFGNGLANIAALSFAANYPTVAAVPHSLVNGYKNILALTLVTDYTFPLAEKAMAAAAAPPRPKRPSPKKKRKRKAVTSIFSIKRTTTMRGWLFESSRHVSPRKDGHVLRPQQRCRFSEEFSCNEYW